ncbi:MAG: hypothetical protein EWM50_06385 [Gottschalkiaceae bacterium]|nr:MAG: hypothetical protein EWM50_06385 [Gottschalkiaceae bacterium]
MQFDEVCQNCNYFIQDSNDLRAGLGVCLKDDIFQPFHYEILENANFSECYDLYLEKRFDGLREVCNLYEEINLIDISENEAPEAILTVEQMRTSNLDNVVNDLYDSDLELVNRAVRTVISYAYIGNTSALKGLLNYYMSLGSAVSLEDVYLRIKIIEMLSSKKIDKDIVSAYINELARTPSNNTTRQLYTKILDCLKRCPLEMVEEPLIDLLNEKEFSYKIKKRIMEVMTIRETDEFFYW